MDYEMLGFLKANKHRMRVLEMLSSGSASEGEIAHRLRLSAVAVRRTLGELMDKGLVEAGGREGYRATERGRKTLRSMAR
jgi:Mn-dependent DtxR family transcriptional regulator